MSDNPYVDGFQSILATLSETYVDVVTAGSGDTAVPETYYQQVNPVDNTSVPLAANAEVFIKNNVLLVVGALVVIFLLIIMAVGAFS